MNITSIILHRKFEKAYTKQSANTKKAFKMRVNLLFETPLNPLLNNHPLHGEWLNYRSINITGDIRAIFFVENATAIFITIGSHSELYK